MNERGISRTVAVLSILAIVTAVSVWMRRRDIETRPVIGTGTPTVPSAKPLPASVTDPETHPVEEAADADEPVAQADPELQNWIRQEAQELDNLRVDADEKRRQIRALVARMTPQQSRQLLTTVKNPKAPAGEKILSTYLLVEGGARTQKELTDLIKSPLPNREFAPHSAEEMNTIREKSLRIMAIDGLFSRAQREPGAKDALAQAARETADPTIRAYAEDKLRQLQ